MPDCAVNLVVIVVDLNKAKVPQVALASHDKKKVQRLTQLLFEENVC